MHDGMVGERRVLHYTSVSTDGALNITVHVCAGQIKPKNREEKHQPKYTQSGEREVKPSRERRLLPMKHTNEML